MHVTVQHLCKSFGSYEASKDISFDIGKGRLVALLGPSGSGKTTILRMLAGLEQPDSGTILFHGRKVNDLPPQKRGIGFVFQNYALFRHMNVFDNVAFGLSVRKVKRKEIADRVAELLELTGLSAFAKRYPNQLSGGQKQRVAFARALAPGPELLLLDEPFAAIDAKVRKELRVWLKEMIRRVGVTTVFVTHDQEEAMEVADEIMIINEGRLEQKGTPADIYRDPATPFVARFVGESTVLEQIGELKGFEDLPQQAVGVIRPEFVEAGRKQEISCLAAAEEGRVRDVLFCGGYWRIELEAAGRRLTATRKTDRQPLEIGEQVWVLIHRLYVFGSDWTGLVENARKLEAVPYSMGW